MFEGLHSWWARRLALISLCLSLERQSEKWKITDEGATKDEICISLCYDSHLFYTRYVVIHCDGSIFRPNRRWSQRIRKAMKRGAAFQTLRLTVKNLQLKDTPLQREKIYDTTSSTDA